MYNDTSLKDVDTAILRGQWNCRAGRAQSTDGSNSHRGESKVGSTGDFQIAGKSLKKTTQLRAGRWFPTKTLNGFEIGSDENIVCRDAKKIYIFKMIDTFLW